MASTSLNLSETFPVSDTIVVVHSPEQYFESLEDNLSVVDTISEIHTERTFKNIEDGIAVGEVIGVIHLFTPIYNFEDSVILSEDFVESHTLRTINSLEDVLTLLDDISVEVLVQPRISLAEVIGLVDVITYVGTNRNYRGPSDIVSLIETFVQEFGIKTIDGTIDGESFKSFQVNDSGSLMAIPPLNQVFVRWKWAAGFKEGIENIYDPSTTLIVPSGGGETIAESINIGAIDLNVKSVVIILDLFDFEYIEDPDGDYILTKETSIIVGDSMSVAKTNLTIEQGSTFSKIVIYRDSYGDPVDLSGYTAEMQIRKTKESGSIILTLNTSNGYLVLGGIEGTITIDIPADITDALDFVWGRYDLELYPAGVTNDAIRLLEGKINLSKQVTQ